MRAGRTPFGIPSPVPVSWLLCLILVSALGVFALAPAASAANIVGPVAPATCVTAAHPCATFAVDIARDDAVPLRGYSVTFHLSAELMLCSGLGSITQGTYLSGTGFTNFQIIDHGGGSFTVDCAILGLPCGATAGTGSLFQVAVQKASGDGMGVLTVDAVTLRDCDNQPVPSAAGPAASVAIDYTPPAAVSDLSAAQDLSANGPDGTTAIALTFTPPADASIVRVYRAAYGVGDGSSAYPEYSDVAGAGPPPAPPWPPEAPWALTGVTASGQADEPPARGYWYYAVYTEDACGNVSAVSNVTGGTLDYHLGDVSDGLTSCLGDNLVATADVSLLGANYGASLAFDDPVNCLDVGPTADGSTGALPQTDNQVQFEDLMIFALNYGLVSLASPAPAVSAEAVRLDLQVAAVTPDGITAALVLHGNVNSTKGVHALVGFDAGQLRLLEARPGALATGGAFFKTFSDPRGLVVDLAQLGAGAPLPGSGQVAVLRFARRGASALPALIESDLRGLDNRPVGPGRGAADMRPAGPEPASGAMPARLLAARPNPFRGTTEIAFVVEGTGRIDLSIHDASGRLVRTLASGPFAPGTHSVAWDGRSFDGTPVGPGVYFCSLRAEGGAAAHKLIVTP